MISELIKKNVSEFVLSDYMSESKYYIVLDEDSLLQVETSCLILVKTRREIELLLLCLGDEVNVVMNEKTRIEHQEIWDWLYERTYCDVINELNWSYKEELELVQLIDRIPVPKMLNNRFVQLDNEDLKLTPIDQRMVHKIDKDKVLLSEPYRCGNMIYFNGFKESSEFEIDHTSNHLEGIIIFEVARQAGIASGHLAGIPEEGTMIILKSFTNYTRFIENDKPYIIRTIPVIKKRGGYCYCIYSIFQNGHSCSNGYFSGVSFNSKKSYQRFMKS